MSVDAFFLLNVSSPYLCLSLSLTVPFPTSIVKVDGADAVIFAAVELRAVAAVVEEHRVAGFQAL